MRIIPFKELKNCKYHCKNVKGYLFSFLAIFMGFLFGMILYRTWIDENNIYSIMGLLLLFFGISLFIILIVTVASIFASRRYMDKLFLVSKLSPQAAEIVRSELEERYGARLHWSLLIQPPLLFFIGKILEHSTKTGKNLVSNAEIAKNMMDTAVKYDERLQVFYNDSFQTVAIKLEPLVENTISKLLTSNIIKKVFIWTVIIVMVLHFIVQIINMIR